MPAFGIAIMGRVVTAAIRSMAVSTVAGPTLQLQPIPSTPHDSMRAAAVSGEAPSRQLASSSTVTMTTTGTSGAATRAAKTACSASLRATMVSMISRSTPTPGPPLVSARICSAKASRASSSPVLPNGSRCTPRGPTEPATQAVPACLSAS